MLDCGRVVIFAWALFRVARAREWAGEAAVAIAAYLFALSVVSGFTIRATGSMNPLFGLSLVFLGPSSLPRGPLPPLPLADVVIAAPVATNAIVSLALLVLARRWNARIAGLPHFADATYCLARASLALVLVAVFEGFAAVLRVMPELLNRQLE